MPHEFYREDGRNLSELTDEGFKAWVQLELRDIRVVISRYNGIYTAPIFLKEGAAKWLSDAVNAKNWYKKTLNISTLGDLIKSKVDHSSVQISTGITQEGGGRGKNHLFKITYPGDLYMVDAKTGLYTKNPASFKVIVNAKLVMDAPKLADANLIAIAIRGGEVAFLTRIPKDWITQIR